jgi:hypothetical protein
MNPNNTTYSSSSVNVAFKTYGLTSYSQNYDFVSPVGDKLYKIRYITDSKNSNGRYNVTYEASYQLIDQVTQTLGAKTVITTKTYSDLEYFSLQTGAHYGNQYGFASRHYDGFSMSNDWYVLSIAVSGGWFEFDTQTGKFSDWYGDGTFCGGSLPILRNGSRDMLKMGAYIGTEGSVAYTRYLSSTKNNKHKAIKFK